MAQDVVIIDSGGANFASVEASLARLDVKTRVSSNPTIIQSADKVILPGVGAAGHAMEMIHAQGLLDVIRSLKQPVLGICLGQQMLCTSSEEGHVDCLGIIPSKVKKLHNAPIVPHMGWDNLVTIKQDEPLLEGITTDDDFYFVHSYFVEINKEYTLATCHYGVDFAAIIRNNNFYGVQFHPEKSGVAGAKILRNFLSITEV